MTKDEKTALQKEILDKINELCEGNEARNAVLVISVDVDNERVITHNMGDVQLLSAALINQLDKNMVLRRFMFSTFGAYLSKNAEAKQEFDQGMELMKNALGMN
jgi:hypothetical protein